MGIFGKWLEKRRMNELTRINKEIEALKQHGPHYMEDKEKKSVSSSSGGRYVKKDTNFGLLLLVGLCIVAIIGLSLFFKQRFDRLSDNYNEKLNELESVKSQYANTTTQLNETSSKLAFKEKVEKDLSGQYKSLETRNKDLTTDNTALEDQVDQLNDKVSTLQDTIKTKDKTIKDIKDCINDNDVDDKEDCI